MAFPFGRENYAAQVIFHVANGNGCARVVPEMDIDRERNDSATRCAIAIERTIRLLFKATPEELDALASIFDLIEERVESEAKAGRKQWQEEESWKK